jgi:prepilin-type processing-associated H-X9-DG protein
MNHRMLGNRQGMTLRRGMTLTDVVAALAVCVVLAAMGCGGLSASREQANRVKCADNLRQIGMAALMYSNGEVRTGSYPRTYFNTASSKLVVDTTGYGKRESFDAAATGDNNVTASFYLILKTQDITPDVFICPSTTAVRGFGPGTTIGVKDSSNWEAIPGNVTYSYSCPFPTQAAVAEGWKFNNTLGSDVPLAADLNPGGSAMLQLTATAAADQMKAGNSHNHNGEGQNVVYCDGHVEFQNTPFCGNSPSVPPKAGEPTSRDNIYTYGGPSDSNGGVGIVGMPANVADRVLLPAGDVGAGK